MWFISKFGQKRNLVQIDVLTLIKFSYLKIETVCSSETPEKIEYITRCKDQRHDYNLNKTAVNT
jgi:hypothetical protein